MNAIGTSSIALMIVGMSAALNMQRAAAEPADPKHVAVHRWPWRDEPASVPSQRSNAIPRASDVQCFLRSLLPRRSARIRCCWGTWLDLYQYSHMA